MYKLLFLIFFSILLSHGTCNKNNSIVITPTVFTEETNSKKCQLSSLNYQDGDVLNIVVNTVYPSDTKLNCTLIIPDFTRRISTMYEKIDPKLTGIENLKKYNDSRFSCTFRVYPKIIQRLADDNGYNYLGTDWQIIMNTGMTEETIIFYMNTLSWFKSHQYTALKLSARLLSKYADVEYI